MKVLVHVILLNRAYAHVHAYTQMMTAKLAKEAMLVNTQASTTATALSTGQSKSSGNVSTATNGKSGHGMEGSKRKTSIFYPPYTGYDQPTRDEGQLAMPKLQSRRSYSDTSFLAAAQAAAALVKSEKDEDEVEEEPEPEEDFCSLQSYSTDVSAQHRGKLKSPSHLETEAKFRQFLVDVDDMQISYRKAPREFCGVFKFAFVVCNVIIWYYMLACISI